MGIDHVQKVAERLMEDKNFRLQDFLAAYISFVIDADILDNNGKNIGIDSLEFTTELERMIKRTSEDIREEEKEDLRNDYLDGNEAEAV